MSDSRTDRTTDSPDCEAIALVSTDGTDPCRKRVVGEDEYRRCANDAVGKYRLRPEQGDGVANWLCRRHYRKYHDLIVDTLETR